MSHRNDIYSYFIKAGDSTHKSWEKGSFLCRERGVLSMLHYIVSGKCRVFRTMNSGREIMYRIYTPGSVIGDIEFFTGGDEASCSVQCIEHTETLMMPINKLRENPAADPGLVFRLGQGIARKLHENSVSEALNTFHPLEVRLAHYYLTFTDPMLSAGSLGQLADWMGCSYRHLTRCLSDLRAKKAVKKIFPAGGTGTGYDADDVSILESIAAPILQEEYGRTLFEGSNGG